MKYPNIEAERARLGLTKDEFARKLGIATKTYYNWLNGANPIPSDALVAMSDMCNSEIDYLLGRTEEKGHEMQEISGIRKDINEKLPECLIGFDDETVLHYCKKEDMANAVEEHGGMDWAVGDERNIREVTADMAGFGIKESQRIIIDYHKGYGKFLVRRILMDYGAI